MYQIYKRLVKLTLDKRYYGNRFANPTDKQGKLTYWFGTAVIDSDPELLFQKLKNGYFDEYDFPMSGDYVFCEECQVVKEPTGDSDLWLDDFVINNAYKEPRFKI